jgi:hypothetical protein
MLFVLFKCRIGAVFLSRINAVLTEKLLTYLEKTENSIVRNSLCHEFLQKTNFGMHNEAAIKWTNRQEWLLDFCIPVQSSTWKGFFLSKEKKK